MSFMLLSDRQTENTMPPRCAQGSGGHGQSARESSTQHGNERVHVLLWERQLSLCERLLQLGDERQAAGTAQIGCRQQGRDSRLCLLGRGGAPDRQWLNLPCS